MPRALDDATRFTATFPHAHSKPTFASTISVSPPPPNETPAQKVVRLREAARKARLPQETIWDTVVRRGRFVADKAHRVVTTSLIGLSLVAGGFAALSLGDMMIHNSRKKKEWFVEQTANYDRAVALAKKAESEGNLTNDLRLFLNNERAIEEAKREKVERGSLWQRVKKQAFGGLAMQDRPGGAIAAFSSKTQKELRAENQLIADNVGTTQNVLHVETATQNSTPERLANSDASNIMKGPGSLDKFGENAASGLLRTASQWRGWIGWR